LILIFIVIELFKLFSNLNTMFKSDQMSIYDIIINRDIEKFI